MNNHNQQKTGLGGNDHMKKSPSELALEALLRPEGNSTNNDHNNHNNNNVNDRSSATAGIFSFGDASNDLGFAFKSNNQDIMDGFSACGGLGGATSWYQNFSPQQLPCISATIDSQSSICAGSPTSTLKPKAEDNQGSGSSEDDDAEFEAGPSEQSNDPLDVKRVRRMVSNRESARRSRRRRQAHLQDLEMQVEQLGGENVTLYKQLTEATQQLRDATTNNRVLKSDVEALRAKVKLAEDMVTRGSLSCSLNHILQTHMGSPQSVLNTQGLSRLANVSPTVSVRGQNSSFAGVAFPSSAGGSVDHVLNRGNSSVTGLVSEAVSCLSEMWPMESPVSSK